MPEGAVRQRLRGSLREAMRAKNAVALSALRSALAALDNAEAVPAASPDGTTTATHSRLAGTVVGVGAAETARRRLSDDEQLTVLRTEIDERLSAAIEFEVGGQPDRAERLRAEADVLVDVLES